MVSYSQFGEDVMLWDYFQRKPQGFYVEAGANHPTLNSQSWFFEQQGWKGILVEPIPEKGELLRKERPNSRIFQSAVGAPEQRGRAQFNVAVGDSLSGLKPQPGVAVERLVEVEVQTLDDILAEAGNPRLDFISIDVEGFELEALRGFDLARHRPPILLVEDHLQRMAVHRYLVGQGYRLVRRTGCNSWYVPANAEFPRTLGEKISVWKEIHLDTPVRCVRYAVKRWKARRRAAG